MSDLPYSNTSEHRWPEAEATVNYDRDEAKGTVTLMPGVYGPTLIVNGRDIGYIDLYPCVEGKPAQLIFFDERWDDPLAKVVIEKDTLVVVVNGDAAHDASGEYAIHGDARDLIFALGEPTT